MVTIVKLSVIQVIINITSEGNGPRTTVFRKKKVISRGTLLPCEIAKLGPLVADAFLSGWGTVISHVYQVGKHTSAYKFKSSASADQNDSCIFSFKMCMTWRAQTFHNHLHSRMHSGTPVINILNLGLQKYEVRLQDAQMGGLHWL